MKRKDLSLEEQEKTSSSGEEIMLTFLFGVLLAAVFGVLVMDFRMLAGSAIQFASPLSKQVEVTATPLAPAQDNDQIRRYSPEVRLDFGVAGRPRLPGLTGDPDAFLAGSMTFHNAGSGIASAIGQIDAGTFGRFEKFLSAQPTPIKTLYLHSPGGSVHDAIEMAERIRELKINTVITKHGYCASSCPLVMSGGVERIITKPAALGVHQIFTSDTAVGTLQRGIENAQSVSAKAQQLLDDMGVDPRAWIVAMSTPKDKLYLFSEKEFKDYNWVTKSR